MLEQTAQEYPLTKYKLLDAALKLMLTKGYHATTVDEICAEAKVTKGSFFHYFKSKEDAGKETIHFFEKLQLKTIHSAGLDQISDPWEKLHKYLDFFVLLANNPDSPRSCLTAIMTQELADTYSDFRGLCEDKFISNAKPLKDLLDEVIIKYPPNRPLDSQNLSEYFLSIYQGSLILAKSRQNRSVLVENIEHYRSYMKILFNK